MLYFKHPPPPCEIWQFVLPETHHFTSHTVPGKLKERGYHVTYVFPMVRAGKAGTVRTKSPSPNLVIQTTFLLLHNVLQL